MEKQIQLQRLNPIDIELYFDEDEEIELFKENQQFENFILFKSLKLISLAIQRKQQTLELFHIFNLSMMVVLDKTQYIPVLKKILGIKEQQEDYNTCAEIKDLINKCYEI